MLHQVQPVTWGQLTAQGSKRELQDRRGLSQHRLELRLQQDKQARLEKAKVLNKHVTSPSALAQVAWLTLLGSHHAADPQGCQ